MSLPLRAGLCCTARIVSRNSTPKHLFKTRRFYTAGDREEDGNQTRASTESPEAGPSSLNREEPLFKTTESPWDLVFKGIDDMSPPIASSTSGIAFPRKFLHHPHLAHVPPGPHTPYLNGRTPVRSSRRQSMTAREINAFDDMFNLIFQAVSEQREKDKLPTSSGIGSRQCQPGGFSTVAREGEDDALGVLYGKLKRRGGRTVKEDEELLDRKREQIELCATDHELLEWAMRELFDESVKYEEAAREAVAESSKSTNTKKSSPPHHHPALQPPCYAPLLALLMRTFREKYRDPHTALSLFAHAQRLSIASYVFGCTTPAYNELLHTRWACFRDLRGVADALAEMRVNGVQPDARTRALAEEVRREVGARNLWQEESGLVGSVGGAGANESVFELLQKIEDLSFRKTPKARDGDILQNEGRRNRSFGRRRWTVASESWKNSASTGEESDEYKFGDWSFNSNNETSSRY